jgi:adenine-specific DNA-methyltransferase
MPAAIDSRHEISEALRSFSNAPLRQAATEFLKRLGYASSRTLPTDSVEDFCRQFDATGLLDHPSALKRDWKSIDLLFQLTDEDISVQDDLFDAGEVQPSLLKSYLFFAVELTGDHYARGKLTALARQVNRLFPMPVMVLMKHMADKKEVLSIAVINRRQNQRDASRDVLGKVTIIRDISLSEPHRGHLDILASFSRENLVHPKKEPINSFDSLHAAWEQIFNVDLLNERFYKELSNWYFWALPQVEFPDDLEKDVEKRRATGLIRLLTRLIFCWFLKEKGLIPEKLFHPTDLAKVLKGFDPESETSSTFYLAILQNLFFATLNQRMGKDSKGSAYRFFATDEGFQKNRETYDVNNLYRYEKLFSVPEEEALALFADIPFLNGGLFECLDRTEEGTNKKRYLDGFSRNTKKRPHVPDRLFFDSGETADLSEAYGDKKRKAEKVTGLISILNRYKFTIIENTPIDQEIALDPELLGKVFENLLASYNEETKTTARKQTGSFYTPRPIVEYMVDESLKAHLSRILAEKAGMKEEDAKAGLDLLFTYTEKEHPFSDKEVATLITAIDEVKILDPACGSGAFPMGVLHKLVYILGKLDPDNERWKQTQLAKLDSAPMREAVEAAFADNADDYGRKLSLIENCLYGVDIQPIAIQITKLRFFISLVCDQKTNRNKKDNHGIRPLPNLETKFVAANSLIGFPRIGEDSLIDPRLSVIENDIESLYHSHFSIQRRDQKISVQKRIKSLRNEMANILAESLMSPEKGKRIANWDPFDPQLRADFFDPHWMFGISVAHGFDVTIGNPPYVRADEQGDANTTQRQAVIASKQYETLWEKWDLFIPFLERSYKLLRPGGISTMIVSDAFCHAKYAEKAQHWFLQNARIIRLDFCGEVKIFDAAVHNVITCFQKANGSHSRPLRRFHRETFGEVTELPTDEQARLTIRVFFPEDAVAQKFTCETVTLSSICYVTIGMVVNAHEDLAQGAFTMEDLVQDSCDTTHPKRFVEGKHLGMWLPTTHRWLEWGTERAPRLFRRKTFPEIYEVSEKVLVQRSPGPDPKCCYDDKHLHFTESTVSFIPWHSLEGVRNNSLKKAARYFGEKPLRPDLPKREEREVTSRRFAVKYLLGVMNSGTARDFLRANRRSNIHLYPDDWKKIPIPNVSAEQQQPIINLVDQILALKSANATADVSEFEKRIDACVAMLYGLTSKENAIAEETCRQARSPASW